MTAVTIPASGPTEVRYIKLGPAGRWERISLAKGELHFGYAVVPHDLCRAGDWDAVLKFLTGSQGQPLAVARDACREIRDFYTLGESCLWITLAEGHLWWAFAEPEVQCLGGAGEEHGARMRRTINGWRNTDRQGGRLQKDQLSTRLTLVGSYRKTICRVAAEGYLLRRLAGEEEPILTRAREVQAAMIAAAEEMIRGLHWADFETLVDLIFSRTGWQRMSRTGGTQKDIDLVVRNVATGERASVQVKSRAGAAALEDYLQRFDSAGLYDRLFFICHTEIDLLDANGREDLQLWKRSRLAELSISAGLFDWLMEKSA